MPYNSHSELTGKHAILSPSKQSWLNYTEDDLMRAYASSWAPQIGTSLHDFAMERIKWRLKMNKSEKNDILQHLFRAGIPANVIDIDQYYPNLMNYVNDAIGFRLVPEVVLAYSTNCFGTTDAISEREVILAERMLRIHDLKTGTTPAHMEQLMIYAALYCLEYKAKPGDMDMELRIYQGGEIFACKPDPEDIWHIMKDIIAKNKALEQRRLAL